MTKENKINLALRGLGVLLIGGIYAIFSYKLLKKIKEQQKKILDSYLENLDK